MECSRRERSGALWFGEVRQVGRGRVRCGGVGFGKAGMVRRGGMRYGLFWQVIFGRDHGN